MLFAVAAIHRPLLLRFAPPPRCVGRRMATVLPRNRGLKTRGQPSKKDIACRSGTPLKPHTPQHPLSSVPYRHASFIMDLSLRVQEPSVTRQGGRPGDHHPHSSPPRRDLLAPTPRMSCLVAKDTYSLRSHSSGSKPLARKKSEYSS